MANELDGLYPNSQTPPTTSKIGSSARKWDVVNATTVIATTLAATTVSATSLTASATVTAGTSGLMPSGVVVTTPNGSGYRIVVANDGTISADGPFAL